MQRLGCSLLCMVPCGDFSGSSWVRAVDVFECMPNTIFQNYVKIVLDHTNEYQPHVINYKLPEELWQYTECDACGRKPWEDWALMEIATWLASTVPHTELSQNQRYQKEW